LGEAAEFSEAVDFIRKEPQLGYEVGRIVSPTEAANLVKIISEEKVQIVVLGEHPMHSDEISHSLYEAIFSRVSFVDYIGFFETLTGRIRQLAERYTTPLPQLTDEAATLAARVEEHLKKMGFQA